MTEPEGVPEEQTLTYLAFDPGETTGVAEFNSKGECLRMHQLKIDDLMDYMSGLEFHPKVVIIEEYKIFGHKAMSHSQSKVPTIQVIGMIKAAARMLWGNPEVVEQPAAIKTTGYLIANVKTAKNHKDSHGLDAFVHGYYYLVRQGVVIPK